MGRVTKRKKTTVGNAHLRIDRGDVRATSGIAIKEGARQSPGTDRSGTACFAGRPTNKSRGRPRRILAEKFGDDLGHKSRRRRSLFVAEQSGGKILIVAEDIAGRRSKTRRSDSSSTPIRPSRVATRRNRPERRRRGPENLPETPCGPNVASRFEPFGERFRIARSSPGVHRRRATGFSQFPCIEGRSRPCVFTPRPRKNQSMVGNQPSPVSGSDDRGFATSGL